jgi:uncharacterized protein (DUF736 family)
MSLIGQFSRTRSGYAGHVHTLSLDIKVVLVPAEHSDAENAPDYRIHVGEDDAGPEIGAAWKRTGEKAGEYVSLLIDDPVLPQPIRANLFHSSDDGTAWGLHWNRPPRRGDRD